MPSPTILIPSPNGIRLKTSKTYCEENIIIIPSLDTSRTGGGSFQLGAADPTVLPLSPAPNTVGFSEIKFTIDPNTIKAEYIIKGHTILGIVGTASAGIIPTGKYILTDLQEHDITEYATIQVENPENFVSGNIRAGVTLLGVTGDSNVINTTLTSGAPASRHITEGYAAFVNGQRIDGTMTQYNGPTSVDLTTGAQFTFETSGKYVENDLIVTPILDNSKVSSPVILGANALSNITPAADTLGLSGVNFQIDSTVLKAENIRKNVTILGIKGSYQLITQEATVDPSPQQQIIRPDIYHDGLSSVTVNAIKITTATITPTKAQQIITSPENYYYKSVTINAIPAEYIIPTGQITLSTTGETNVSQYATAYIDPTNIISDNIKSGITILGVSGNPKVVDTTVDTTPLSSQLVDGIVAFANGQRIEGTMAQYSGDYAIDLIENDSLTLAVGGKYVSNDIIVTPIMDSSKIITPIVIGSEMLQSINPAANTIGLTGVHFILDDTIIKAEYIKKDVTILGITGTYELNLQTKTVVPTKAEQTIEPDSGFNGMDIVIVEAIPSEYIDTTEIINPATTLDVCFGKIAYVNGNKIIGSRALYNGAYRILST